MTAPDLTPRARPAKPKRSFLSVGAVVVVIVAIGALVFKTLGDASLFFKNVDEAIAQRDELGDKRFRMQGTVVPGSISNGEVDGRGAVLFTVSYNGEWADVASFDNPTELFKEGIPVVLEGFWREEVLADDVFAEGANDGWFFSSNRILVKHDASYEADNSDRIKEAEDRGQVPHAAEAGTGTSGAGTGAAGGVEPVRTGTGR